MHIRFAHRFCCVFLNAVRARNPAAAQVTTQIWNKKTFCLSQIANAETPEYEEQWQQSIDAEAVSIASLARR